jgi:hypothetical protein
MFLIERQNLSDKILIRHQPIRAIAAEQGRVG